MSRLQTPASTTFNNCAEHTLLYAQYHTRPPVGLITKHSITYTSQTQLKEIHPNIPKPTHYLQPGFQIHFILMLIQILGSV